MNEFWRFPNSNITWLCDCRQNWKTCIEIVYNPQCLCMFLICNVFDVMASTYIHTQCVLYGIGKRQNSLLALILLLLTKVIATSETNVAASTWTSVTNLKFDKLLTFYVLFYLIYISSWNLIDMNNCLCMLITTYLCYLCNTFYDHLVGDLVRRLKISAQWVMRMLSRRRRTKWLESG
jgi:hypothetical protein